MVVQRACHVSANQLRLWTFAARPVFPLHFGPADHQPDNQAVLKFPLYRGRFAYQLMPHRLDEGWNPGQERIRRRWATFR